MELLSVVDMDDSVVGCAEKFEVHENFLYHRSVHLIIFVDDDIVIQLRSNDKDVYPDYWDVSVAGHVKHDESYEDAARRECWEELGVVLGDIELITKYKPKYESGYEYCSLYFANINLNNFKYVKFNKDEIKDIRIISVSELLKSMCSDEGRYTYNIYRAMLSFLDMFFLEKAVRVQLIEKINKYFIIEENKKCLQYYKYSKSTDKEYEDLKNEIYKSIIGRDDHVQLFREIFRVYDNVRPYYPAPNGLEVGGVVLGAKEIREYISVFAESLLKYKKICIVAKLDSGRMMANALYDELEAKGYKNKYLFGIKTSWRGHLVVDIDDVPHFEKTDSGVFVICDTMISSGVTAKKIIDELNDKKKSNFVLYFVLISVNRYRVYEPMNLVYCKELNSHDWTIGYNSDCYSGGESCGREIPFLCTLKPVGQGLRGKMIEDFNKYL